MNPVHRRKGSHGHLGPLQWSGVNGNEVGVPAFVRRSFLDANWKVALVHRYLNMNCEVAQPGQRFLNLNCGVAHIGLSAIGIRMLSQ